MYEQLKWQFELDEYIRQGEPGRAERSGAWKVGIGLQAVDGLSTSAYLLDTAKSHIEGDISIGEVQRRLHSYYEQHTERDSAEENTREADLVSARIAEILGEKTFQFSPAEWSSIHRRLFNGCLTMPAKSGRITSPRENGFCGVRRLLMRRVTVLTTRCGMISGRSGRFLTAGCPWSRRYSTWPGSRRISGRFIRSRRATLGRRRCFSSNI